jgi:hypothetical protein
MTTIQIRDAFTIEMVLKEQVRRHNATVAGTAEQLLIERLLQVECFTDKNFMDVFGDKIAERKWIREQVEKNTATERKQIQEKIEKGTSAAVVTRTNELMAEVAELQAEVDTLRADNAKIAWELDEWKAGRRQRVSRAPVRREPVKSQREIEFDAEQERVALEEANRSLRDAERRGEVHDDDRTDDEINHDIEMQSRKGR